MRIQFLISQQIPPGYLKPTPVNYPMQSRKRGNNYTLWGKSQKICSLLERVARAICSTIIIFGLFSKNIRQQAKSDWKIFWTGRKEIIFYVLKNDAVQSTQTKGNENKIDQDKLSNHKTSLPVAKKEDLVVAQLVKGVIESPPTTSESSLFPSLPPASVDQITLKRIKTEIKEGQKHLSLNPNFDRENLLKDIVKNEDIEQLEDYFNRFGTFQINKSFNKENELLIETTLLITAIENQNQNFFDFLINQMNIDLDVNLKGRYSTALHQACSLGNNGDYFINSLIELGADPTLKDAEGFSALDIAIKNQVNRDTVENLKNWVALNETDENNNNLLQQAILAGDIVKFSKILDSTICLNHQNHKKQTALHIALELACSPNGHLKHLLMIERLVDLVENFNLEDEDGFTPLHRICSSDLKKRKELAIEMLKKGAHFESPNKDGITVWDLLIKYPDSDPVKKWILENSRGEFIEHTKRLNLASILGISFTTFTSTKIFNYEGQNISINTFPLLNQCLDEFLKNESLLEGGFNKEIQPLFKQVKESIEFSTKLVTTHEIGWTEAKQVLDKKEVPFILPVTWNGHGFSLVFYKNRFAICNRGDQLHVSFPPGMNVFSFDSSKLTEDLFNELNQTVGNKEEFSNLIRKIPDIRYRGIFPLKPQKNENCAWSSNACLSLRAALILKNMEENEIPPLGDEINFSMKKFTHYAKLWLVNHYITEAKNQLSTAFCLPSSEGLTLAAIKLCKKIKAGKDQFGYLKQALDLITFCGIPLDYDLLSSSDLNPHYALLYQQQNVEIFLKALSGDKEL